MPAGIHYEVHGSGPALMLLAGLTQDVTQWGGLIAALAERFTVIAHDPRGAGRTTASFDGLTTEVMAQDALALLDELDMARAHVLGFSLGGMTAQVLAATHPERVDRLVLASSGSRIGIPPMAAIRAARTLFAASQCAVYANDALIPWLLGQNALLDGSIGRGFATRAYKPSLEGFTAQCDALAAHDGGPFLPRILAPTLCLAGAQDLLIPPPQGRDMASIIPNASFWELPDSGHMCFLEVPSVFQDALLAFLTDDS
ncbi:alpha/beta fold hydrolase [Fundidesulfovibrio terrae]|uniref:alpha/beta fold hydrolase n=1 Tax=Fundidesulfovibrio terrae TaxID=2922866 RepID=UPI001FAF8D00|nr:alpha/beta hydrolase [Fundidesulfovibrio terrae]